MRGSDSAPVAQLDRVSGYEPEGRAFESLRARHSEHAPRSIFGLAFCISAPAMRRSSTTSGGPSGPSPASCAPTWMQPSTSTSCSASCSASSYPTPSPRGAMTSPGASPTLATQLPGDRLRSFDAIRPRQSDTPPGTRKAQRFQIPSERGPCKDAGIVASCGIAGHLYRRGPSEDWKK